MKIRKSILAGAIVAIGAVSVTGMGIAAAQSSNGSGDNLVEKITSTFNLNREDVQKVFDESRSERQAERQAEASARLQQLVDEGKITAEQKTKIEAKRQELKAKHDEVHDALKAWATENNIDEKYVMMNGPKGAGGPRQSN